MTGLVSTMIDGDLLARIDALAKACDRTRAGWLTAACMHCEKSLGIPPPAYIASRIHNSDLAGHAEIAGFDHIVMPFPEDWF